MMSIRCDHCKLPRSQLIDHVISGDHRNLWRKTKGRRKFANCAGAANRVQAAGIGH